MSTVAFDLQVLELVAALRSLPGDPALARLGAIGPDLFEHEPLSAALADALHAQFQASLEAAGPGGTPTVDLTPIRNDSTLALELFGKPMMAVYTVLLREVVIEFWPLLQRDYDTLGALQAAAQAQDADAVAALKDRLDQVGEDAQKLKQLGLVLKAMVSVLAQVVAIPPAIQSTDPAAKPWIPKGNRRHEFLRWHHTDQFARSLVSAAATADQQAYASGWLCHVAASVTGRPFVNDINGGPYRTHWWRNRLVSNFVDAWTFGRYRTPATMSGDTPSVPYAQWSRLCAANLPASFGVGGLAPPVDAIPDILQAVATGQLVGFPAQVPQSLADQVQAAIAAMYPPVLLPDGFSADAVKRSVVGLVAVQWFMTSGFGPNGWRATDLGEVPSACPDAPDWVTSGGQPPSPQTGPGVTDILEGIVFAICALIDFIFGSWGDGYALLKNAIGHFHSQTDWDQFQCNTWWMRKQLLDAGLGLVDQLVKSGLAYPPSEKLGTVDANGDTHPAVDLSPDPVPLTRSRGRDKVFPLRMDATQSHPDLDFSRFPPLDGETPGTLPLPLPPVYADVIVDGSGLQNGGMRAGGTFPSAGLFFGDAVSNALDLLDTQAVGLPSFNLDGDRGYGFETWNPRVNTFPGNGDVTDPKQEN